jgi:hypothetical protein
MGFDLGTWMLQDYTWCWVIFIVFLLIFLVQGWKN